MTAKQAIKARCKDCLAGSRECAFTDCALKGLANAKRGSNRPTAIRKYCQWCMNGNPVNQCASPDCAIYQFRAGDRGSIKVRFLPQKPTNSQHSDPSKSKAMESYGKGIRALENALYEGQ